MIKSGKSNTPNGAHVARKVQVRKLEKDYERFQRRNALVDELADLDLELLSDKAIRRILRIVNEDLRRADIKRTMFVRGNA